MERRAFLGGLAGMFASGVAAAVLPSGVIMPVQRKICTDVPVWFNCRPIWQDSAGTIPVTAIGQPIGRIDRAGIDDLTGKWFSCSQETSAHRPELMLTPGYGLVFGKGSMMMDLPKGDWLKMAFPTPFSFNYDTQVTALLSRNPSY